MSALSKPKANTLSAARHGVVLPAVNHHAELRLVKSQVNKTRNLPFLMVLLGFILTALIGPMYINTKMASTSYDIHANEVRLAQLLDEQADLVMAVEQAKSPQAIAKRAQAIGLVPAGMPGRISLGNASVSAANPAS